MYINYNSIQQIKRGLSKKVEYAFYNIILKQNCVLCIFASAFLFKFC